MMKQPSSHKKTVFDVRVLEVERVDALRVAHDDGIDQVGVKGTAARGLLVVLVVLLNFLRQLGLVLLEPLRLQLACPD